MAPNSEGCQSELVGIYFDAGRKKDAVALGKKILQQKHHADYLTKIGSLFASRNFTNLARAIFARAMETDPDYPWVYLELGKLYGNLDEFDEAIYSWNEGLKVAPEEKIFIQYIHEAEAMKRDKKAGIIDHRQ